MKPKRVLILSGPTGVGESTITNNIIKRYPIFKRLITATTRKPRLNEKHGRDYYFMSNKKFKEEIKKGNILEYQNNRNKQVYYGTLKHDLIKKLKRGYNLIINPDLTGTKYYKKYYNATTIFLKPNIFNNLRKRQLARNPNIKKHELEKRLAYAKYETENESPFYDYTVINEQDKLDKAVNEIITIIKKEGYKIK